MLLIEITINAVLNRVSDETINSLTNLWKGKVIDFQAPVMKIPQVYGGYCQMGVGKISFSPDLFDDDWPPPVSCAITGKYTSTTQEAAETIFTGTAHLAGFNRGSVTYDIFSPEYDETVAGATAYNDTLNNVLDTILTGIAEIASLDVSAARAVSPNVTHTVSGDQLSIVLASNIAAFYGHLFYIDGTTAYLVDMLLDNGSRTITEFEYFETPYRYNAALSRARSGAYSRPGTHKYGNELSVSQYHDTEANVNTALDDIVTIWEKPRANLPIPFLGSMPNPGEKISFTDTSLAQDTDIWIRARNITFDFKNEEVIIEGEGAVSAA